jgi:DNA-binding NtrC family response regulator
MMNRSASLGTSSGSVTGIRSVPWTSEAMCKLNEDIACAMQFDARVMISGESGAGKKFVAHLIHQGSAGGAGPFIVASGPEIGESLLQSAAGSSAAIQFQQNLLSEADHGTLLIEEIDMIPRSAQRHLVGFVEQTRTAGRRVRLMTATRADLWTRVRAGQFDDDLFYHLNVIHLTIPALRDRPEDIPILFRGYLSYYARAEAPQLSTAARRRLLAYPWPGNVPELKAVAEKVAMPNRPRRLLGEDDLPSHIGR